MKINKKINSSVALWSAFALALLAALFVYRAKITECITNLSGTATVTQNLTNN